MSLATKKQYVTVKALIEKDGKFLFLKDHKGVWELPGGRIDFSESPEEALKRELYEELGYEQVQIDKIVDAWTFCVSKDERDYQFIILVYRCSVKDTEIKQSDEHIEYQWVLRDSVADLKMKNGYRRLFAENYERKI